jgi:hypothetical protein
MVRSQDPKESQTSLIGITLPVAASATARQQCRHGLGIVMLYKAANQTQRIR